MSEYRIEIRESERGWGQRYEYWDGYETLEKAVSSFHRINGENKAGPVPDYYIMAESIEKKDEETGRWFQVFP